MPEIRSSDVMRIWRERHKAGFAARGSAYSGENYAYGVTDYRLGRRRSLPDGQALIVNLNGRDRKDAPKQVRQQVDAIIAEIRAG